MQASEARRHRRHRPARTRTGDAYGLMLSDALDGRASLEIVERDDGFIIATPLGPQLYLAPFRAWPAHERRAMRFVRGRVLDIGCGAGRACLYLQKRGHEVIGIDASPGAIGVCRRRGVRDARISSIEEVDETLGSFDTILLLGNNFGLFGSAANARRLLRRFNELTTVDSRVVASTFDVHRLDDPIHRRYHVANRRKGRLSGQIRNRIRYRNLATPWFDYLMVSARELRGVIRGTGWRIEAVLESGAPFVAILTKDTAAASNLDATH